MKRSILSDDPYNVVITGVGGQGNVMASRVLGNMLTQKGLQVTIGETFGASQRGGSVMSHIRISTASSWSPQIPQGKAHIIMALEPIEALRVLMDYGSPRAKVLCNMRPIHPIGVISGEFSYPSEEQLKESIRELAEKTWFVDATSPAIKLGNPIFVNIMMIGALAGISDLPIERTDFETVISKILPPGQMKNNLAAYDIGAKII